MTIGADVSINYNAKTITVANNVHTVNALYSYLKEVFADPAQMDDLTPMAALTPDVYQLENGWVLTAGSTDYLKSGALQDAAADNIWCNIRTLGDLATGTTLYIEQDGVLTWTAPVPGHIDILFKVKDGGLWIDAGLFQVYARKFQDRYDNFSATGGANVQNVPLSTDDSIDLDIAQGTLDAYTDLVIEWIDIKRSAFDGEAAQKYILDGAINSSVLTMTVTQTITGSPTFLQIDSEVMEIDHTNAKVFTVKARGYGDTDPASHINESRV